MSKILFSNLFGKKSSRNQKLTTADTVVSVLQNSSATTSQTSVTTPTATSIDVQNTVRSFQKYVCEVCTKWGSTDTKKLGSASNLMTHVKNEHPSQWPFQLIIPTSNNHRKKWTPKHIKTVINTYLQLRATQNVGRHFVIRHKIDKTILDAYWVDCATQPDTSNSSHIKAMNAAAMAVGRNSKSVREVLNGKLGATHGVTNHSPILVQQPSGKGPQCELTIYGLKRIKQIRDKSGYVGFGGIEGLESLRRSAVIQTHIELVSDDVVQQPKQSDSVVGDSAVMRPQEQEPEADNLVWKDESSNIISTWTDLTEGVLKYIANLQQQVSDLTNHDQNRIDQEDTFIKEMEGKDQTIAEKDSKITSQKECIIELNNKSSFVPLTKERDELQIQVQNLTEERDTLFTANENLVQQAKAHNKEKQSAMFMKNVELRALEDRMSTLGKDLDNMRKDLE